MAYGARSDRVALGVRVSPLTPIRPRGGMQTRRPQKALPSGMQARYLPGTPNARLAETVDARHLKRLGRSMPVRARRCAPSSCSRRQAAKASALHADNRRFESVRGYHSRAFSSAVERRRDMADAGGSIPSRRTNLRSRSSVAERSVDNRLTQVRFLTGLPIRGETIMNDPLKRGVRNWTPSVKPSGSATA